MYYIVSLCMKYNIMYSHTKFHILKSEAEFLCPYDEKYISKITYYIYLLIFLFVFLISFNLIFYVENHGWAGSCQKGSCTTFVQVDTCTCNTFSSNWDFIFLSFSMPTYIRVDCYMFLFINF